MSVVSHERQASLEHLGLEVRDLPRMQEFYTAVLGLSVSDRGVSERRRQEMVFMTGTPAAHHQLVLVAGEPHEGEGRRLDHIAFAVGTLAVLRVVRDLAEGTGATVRAVDHGNAWSIYFADPEGNQVEVFARSQSEMPQPFGRLLDLDQADAEIRAATQQVCNAR